MSDESFENDEALRLADILIEKPLSWRQPLSGPSHTPVLRFVKFRAFSRAVAQYGSLVLLLKAGQWEDTLILARSLYELNLNLSEISSSADPEDAAKRFVKFGKLLLIRLDQKRLTDRVIAARLKSPASVDIADCNGKLAEIAVKLDRDFAEFRTPKGKWQESWSGPNVEELARRLADNTGGPAGRSDYFVFKLASLFTHDSPGSLFLELPRDRATIDWNDFRAALDDVGHEGLRHFLHEASVCLVDIVGIAGDSIAGYERKWFDDFALPLLQNL